MVVSAEVVKGRISVGGITSLDHPALRVGAMLLTILLMSGCSFLDRLLYKTPEQQCLSDRGFSKEDKFRCLCRRLDTAAGSYEYFFHNRQGSSGELHTASDKEIEDAFQEFKRCHEALVEWKKNNGPVGGHSGQQVLLLVSQLDRRITVSHKNKNSKEGIVTGGTRPVSELRDNLRELLYPESTAAPQPKSP